MGELTRDELLALLQIVAKLQGEVVLGLLGEKTMRHLAAAFDGFEDLSQVEPDAARVIQGLERLGPRLRLALGETVQPDQARPLS
ncbi:hypothetical protein ACLQ28_03225 [Micromonospora sp. DT201]|uniref:hypothetical protein n=1 Tax=Micromonospora sp. DT201 TaxID=3393442 RepID=UPI003CFB41E2